MSYDELLLEEKEYYYWHVEGRRLFQSIKNSYLIEESYEKSKVCWCAKLKKKNLTTKQNQLWDLLGSSANTWKR